MTDGGRETAMVLFECHVCHAQAVCVDNQPARLAWLDHMENHANKTDYGAYTWTAVTFDFDT